MRISIHALREEGDAVAIIKIKDLKISIHALREEGDMPPRRVARNRHNFYPRPPRGGRHVDLFGFLCRVGISIHALREEGDLRIVQ